MDALVLPSIDLPDCSFSRIHPLKGSTVACSYPTKTGCRLYAADAPAQNVFYVMSKMPQSGLGWLINIQRSPQPPHIILSVRPAFADNTQRCRSSIRAQQRCFKICMPSLFPLPCLGQHTVLKNSEQLRRLGHGRIHHHSTRSNGVHHHSTCSIGVHVHHTFICSTTIKCFIGNVFLGIVPWNLVPIEVFFMRKNELSYGTRMRRNTR